MNDWYDENDLQGNLDKVRDAIQSIFEELSKEEQDFVQSNRRAVTIGYYVWCEHCRIERENQAQITTEVLYQQFWANNHDDDDMKPFLRLFELIQLKSYSEAICETVGKHSDLLLLEIHFLS